MARRVELRVRGEERIQWRAAFDILEMLRQYTMM